MFPRVLLKRTLWSNYVLFSSDLDTEKFFPLLALSQTSLVLINFLHNDIQTVTLAPMWKPKERAAHVREVPSGLGSICLPWHTINQPPSFSPPAPSQPGLALTSLARGTLHSAKSWLSPIPVWSAEDYVRSQELCYLNAACEHSGWLLPSCCNYLIITISAHTFHRHLLCKGSKALLSSALSLSLEKGSLGEELWHKAIILIIYRGMFFEKHKCKQSD